MYAPSLARSLVDVPLPLAVLSLNTQIRSCRNRHRKRCSPRYKYPGCFTYCIGRYNELKRLKPARPEAIFTVRVAPSAGDGRPNSASRAFSYWIELFRLPTYVAENGFAPCG